MIYIEKDFIYRNWWHNRFEEDGKWSDSADYAGGVDCLIFRRWKASCEITAVNPFNLDSSNVVPENWSTLVKVVKEHYEDYDGFVIAHGTDTMAYTAAALSI